MICRHTHMVCESYACSKIHCRKFPNAASPAVAAPYELRWCIQHRGFQTVRVLQFRQCPYEWVDVPEVDVQAIAAKESSK